MSDRYSLAQLNAMPAAAFVDALRGIYEHSPWIPQRAASARPFADASALHAALQAVVASASVAEQEALLCAHPELAGKEAQAGSLTAHSTAEQKGAGLVNLDPEEKARIATLNRDYRARFGFPFIIAVRNHTRSSIFAEFERRAAGIEVAAERAECLRQVGEIARFRLGELLRD